MHLNTAIWGADFQCVRIYMTVWSISRHYYFKLKKVKWAILPLGTYRTVNCQFRVIVTHTVIVRLPVMDKDQHYHPL